MRIARLEPLVARRRGEHHVRLVREIQHVGLVLADGHAIHAVTSGPVARFAVRMVVVRNLDAQTAELDGDVIGQIIAHWKSGSGARAWARRFLRTRPQPARPVLWPPVSRPRSDWLSPVHPARSRMSPGRLDTDGRSVARPSGWPRTCRSGRGPCGRPLAGHRPTRTSGRFRSLGLSSRAVPG